METQDILAAFEQNEQLYVTERKGRFYLMELNPDTHSTTSKGRLARENVDYLIMEREIVEVDTVPGVTEPGKYWMPIAQVDLDAPADADDGPVDADFEEEEVDTDTAFEQEVADIEVEAALAERIRGLKAEHGDLWVSLASHLLSENEVAMLPIEDREAIEGYQIDQEEPEEKSEESTVPDFLTLEVIEVEPGQVNGLTKNRPYGIVKVKEGGELPAWPLGGFVRATQEELLGFWTWKSGEPRFNVKAEYKIVHRIGDAESSTPRQPRIRQSEPIGKIVFLREELSGAQAHARAVAIAQERIIATLKRRRVNTDEVVVEVTGLRYTGGAVIQFTTGANREEGWVEIQTATSDEPDLNEAEELVASFVMVKISVQENFPSVTSTTAITIATKLQDIKLRSQIRAILKDAAVVDAVICQGLSVKELWPDATDNAPEDVVEEDVEAVAA